MGQIIHGNKNFGYAQIEEGNKFGTPIMIPGMVSSNIEVEQSDTKVYADNAVWATIKGSKVRTATVNFRKIPASYLPYFGFLQEANGGFVDTGVFAAHCIFFETEETDDSTGLSTPTLHYLYAVKASEPTTESTTDEEDVEAASLEVSYTANKSKFVVDSKGNYVQYFKITRTEENATLYDKFKTKVILPTDKNA